MIYISGPGHGGNAIVAQTYLEGSYTEIYPHITRDEQGLKKLFKQFSFPGGVSSHVAPETPGSINEGGELGYSLAHAYGAVLDNPDLIAACVIGDGELETGPLQASLHINKIMNPKTDGVVLPILNLNGYKIAQDNIDEVVKIIKNAEDEEKQRELEFIDNFVDPLKGNIKLDIHAYSDVDVQKMHLETETFNPEFFLEKLYHDIKLKEFEQYIIDIGNNISEINSF